MSADLAFQKALRARLIATPAVVALVPASGILDVNQRPAPSPSIILGESQVLDPGTSTKRGHERIAHTLHIWKREPSLEGVKTIAGEIKRAIMGGRLVLSGGLHCGDVSVSSMRFLRDPGGEMSHGVVTVEALVSGVAP